MDTRTLIIILVAALVAVGAGLAISKRAVRRRKLILDEIAMMCGGEPELSARCGVIQGASRVPGIIALCHEKIIFRSYIMNFQGEIPLANIEKVEVKRSLSHKYSYKKIVAGMRVMEITTTCDVHRFFIQKASVEEWEKALSPK